MASDQGDQIGRIFALSAIVFLGLLSKMTDFAETSGLLLSAVKVIL
jgi:hypothetical protein